MEYTGIFQGGGIKGLAYIGALYALEQKGFKCTKAAGTSMGAVVASLVASGYDAKELKEVVMSLDFNNLIKNDSKKLSTIISDKGLHSTYYINEQLSKLLSYKKIYNFGDLLDFKEEAKLKVVATNALTYQPIIFPNDLKYYNLNPYLFPVSYAVVMSATYPGFFKPLKLGKVLVLDGGLCNNFPYQVFNYHQDELVIGFQILNKNHKNLPPYINNIKIDTTGFKILNFKINDQGKQKLFMKGYLAAEKMIKAIIQKYQ